MSDKIIASREGGVLRLLFNRPEKKNALDREMYGALIAALEGAEKDDGLRAVVIAGAGADFTAGNDLADFRDFKHSLETFPALAFVRLLASLEKPLVAAVTGDAIGIGAHLALPLRPRLCERRRAHQNALHRSRAAAGRGREPSRSTAVRHGQGLAVSPAGRKLRWRGGAAARARQRAGAGGARHRPRNGRGAPPRGETARRPRGLAPADARRPEEILARIDAEAALFAKALTSPEARERFAAFFAARGG